ncbi:MAG: glycosyltransferase N-terminal domain-containing protein, partial [Candidatus Firestonebacteria bacterium]
AIIFTTTGINGRRMLEMTSKDLNACFLPLDLYFLIKPLVKLINPKILVIAETEYWPNLFYLAKKQGAKIVVVNGRFSEKARKRYLSVAPVAKEVFALTDVFAMRSREDAAFLLTLGVANEKIAVTGDLKYEKPFIDREKKEALAAALGPVLKEKVIVFGSVHSGEAGEILKAFKLIRAEVSAITLILAPRFLEEISSFVSVIEAEGMSYTRRQTPGKEKVDIVILDSFGELSYAYELCSLAFVGGSLADGIGGHNLMEPLYHGKPVFFGPYAFNFKEMEEEVKINLTGFLVKDGGDLAVKTVDLLKSPLMLQNIRKATIEFLEKQKGSLSKTLELI